MTDQPSLRELLAKALTEWGDTASWYVFADKDVDELLATPSGKALASHFEREAALERALWDAVGPSEYCRSCSWTGCWHRAALGDTP